MKKLIVWLCISISLLANGEEIEVSFKQKIETLNERGEYILARDILNGIIDNDKKIDTLHFWVQLDNELYQITSGEIQNLDVSSNRKNVLKSEYSNIVRTKYIEQKVYDTVPIVGFIKSAYDTIEGENVMQVYKKVQVNLLKQNKVPLPDIKKVKKILKNFNILKQSQQDLGKKIKEYIKLSILNNDFEELIKLSKESNDFKDKIKQSRTNFISYVFVRPYLSESHRLILLSNTDLVGHNKDNLREAARIMAKGAYKDILMESNEDVRNQFYDIYQKLKDTAGKKEWEDLKVLQTLSDSVSKAKKTGANLWWE